MAKTEDTSSPDILDHKHDLGKTVVLGLPTPEECLSIYMELGPNRSISKVGVYLGNQRRRVPAMPTLKRWAAKGKWRFHAHEYDVEVSRMAQEELQRDQAKDAAADLGKLATKMRQVSHRMLDKLKNKVDQLKISSGGEAKSLAEAAVALNKAAEVLDGGVSDRTESRNVMTVEERKTKAQSIVDDAFKQFSGGSGQDNAKRTKQPDSEQPVGDAGNARTGTDGV